MPKLSIGLPVYNAERYLRDALDSILSQTYRDFELVISDNASTDSTAEICAGYAEKDQRIRFHRNAKNLGAAENFNKVFNLSVGMYFKWAAYDDMCAPEFLDRCVSLLDREPKVVLCYPKTILVNSQGEKISLYDDRLNLDQQRPHQRLRHILKFINLANPVFGVIRSGALKKTRLLGKYFGADYILLIELALQGCFYEIPEYLFYRRDHELNSRRLPKTQLADWWDTSNKGIFRHLQNRHIAEQYAAITKSELSWNDKTLCYMQMANWVIRRWRAKGGLFKANLKHKLNLGF